MRKERTENRMVSRMDMSMDMCMCGCACFSEFTFARASSRA